MSDKKVDYDDEQGTIPEKDEDGIDIIPQQTIPFGELPF